MKSFGAYGEDIACDYLLKKGFAVRDRNVRFSGGEVDIVASKSNVLVFVEVKTRSSDIKGKPYEAVTARKIRHILSVINWYVRKHNLTHCKVRIDILSIEIQNNKEIIQHFENIEIPD